MGITSSSQPWSGYIPPFKIWGNLYFVGTKPASTHIIDTGEGLIMLDSGYQHSLYIVLQNMHALGLDPMDIKYIVHTHGHIDHFGATRALVEMTGAKTFIGAADRDYANGNLDLSWAKELGLHFETFEPDVLLQDGDEIVLGNTVLKAVSAPGHTPGAMCYFFDVYCNGETLRAGIQAGVGMNSMRAEFLDEYGLSYDCRADFLHSMDRIKDYKVDIFLGNHVGNNKTVEKGKKLLETGVNDFIDPAAWGKFAELCKKRLLRMLEQEAGEQNQ